MECWQICDISAGELRRQQTKRKILTVRAHLQGVAGFISLRRHKHRGHSQFNQHGTSWLLKSLSQEPSCPTSSIGFCEFVFAV